MVAAHSVDSLYPKLTPYTKAFALSIVSLMALDNRKLLGTEMVSTNARQGGKKRNGHCLTVNGTSFDLFNIDLGGAPAATQGFVGLLHDSLLLPAVAQHDVRAATVVASVHLTWRVRTLLVA